MAFYSSKCEKCTERSKHIIKKIKCHDEKGNYYINLYECDNYGCDIVPKVTKNKRKYTASANKV